MSSYDMSVAALTGMVVGALQRLSQDQPIVNRVGPTKYMGTIPVVFNGEKFVVRIERAKDDER